MNEQKLELKSPIQTNKNPRAMIDNDFVFADCSAYKAALNFIYDQDEENFKAKNELIKGDFYFENTFSFDEVMQAVMSVYDLGQGTKNQDTCTWKKNDVKLVLTQKQKYIILEISRES